MIICMAPLLFLFGISSFFLVYVKRNQFKYLAILCDAVLYGALFSSASYMFSIFYNIHDQEKGAEG